MLDKAKLAGSRWVVDPLKNDTGSAYINKGNGSAYPTRQELLLMYSALSCPISHPIPVVRQYSRPHVWMRCMLE